MKITVYLITYQYFSSLFDKFIKLPTKEFISKTVNNLIPVLKTFAGVFLWAGHSFVYNSVIQ